MHRLDGDESGRSLTEIDSRHLRAAAGQYLTGVTVVTTLDAHRRPAGLTVNSFTSVSLHPPLVQFCLGLDSMDVPAFEARNGFVVHVLAADQRDTAVLFSTKGIERFEGVDWRPGVDGLPVLDGAVAVFECGVAAVHEAGDHLIFVGEVRRVEVADDEARPALGYFRGRYVTSPDAG